MSADDVIDRLEQTELFQALSRDEIERIAQVGRVEYWKEGAVVLEEGAYGPRMMVLIEGECAVIRTDAGGTEHTIATVGAGGVLGETSLLLQVPRVATVRARSALKVFAMDRSAFETLVESKDPAILRLGLELSRVLARRVMDLNDRVVGLLEHGGDIEAFNKARAELFTLWDY